MTVNPFEISDVTETTVGSAHCANRRLLRFIIYMHLTIVVFSVFAARYDLEWLIWPDLCKHVIEVIIGLGALAMFACPISLLLCVARSKLSIGRRLTAIVTEAMLTSTHFLALLPAVQ